MHSYVDNTNKMIHIQMKIQIYMKIQITDTLQYNAEYRVQESKLTCKQIDC